MIVHDKNPGLRSPLPLSQRSTGMAKRQRTNNVGVNTEDTEDSEFYSETLRVHALAAAGMVVKVLVSFSSASPSQRFSPSWLRGPGWIWIGG